MLNNAGKITIKGNQFNTAQLQKELLEAEGVEVSTDFELDMRRFRFHPDAELLRNLELDSEYIKSVLVKYDME